MSAMISAEILRLRSVKANLWFAVGLLLVIGPNAVPSLAGEPTSSNEVASQIAGLLQMAVLAAGGFAAYIVGDEFQRGGVAASYLVQPRRSVVLNAKSMAQGALGALVGLVMAGVVMAIVLPSAIGNGVDTGLAVSEILIVLGGATFTGLLMAVVGVHVATVLRGPTAAMMGIVTWSLVETLVTKGGSRDGIWDYLPFQLAGATTGLSEGPPILAAMALLALQAALFIVAVRRFALDRDLT